MVVSPFSESDAAEEVQLGLHAKHLHIKNMTVQKLYFKKKKEENDAKLFHLQVIRYI